MIIFVVRKFKIICVACYNINKIIKLIFKVHDKKNRCLKSRKRQTIRKDRTQSFGFKALHCYDCQTADFLIIKGGQFFVFSEVLTKAFSHKNK